MDFPIPANDDATKSIELIVDEMIKAINEGLEERKNDKTAVDESAEEGEGSEDEAREAEAVPATEEVTAPADDTTEENA